MRLLVDISQSALRISSGPVEIRATVEVVPAYTARRLSRRPFDDVEIRGIKEASATIRSSFVVGRVAVAGPIAAAHGGHTSFLGKNAFLSRQIPATSIAASIT